MSTHVVPIQFPRNDLRRRFESGWSEQRKSPIMRPAKDRLRRRRGRIRKGRRRRRRSETGTHRGGEMSGNRRQSLTRGRTVRGNRIPMARFLFECRTHSVAFEKLQIVIIVGSMSVLPDRRDHRSRLRRIRPHQRPDARIDQTRYRIVIGRIRTIRGSEIILGQG